MSLLILLSSSSFSYQYYLNHAITLQTLTQYDIQQARKNGYFTYLITLFNDIPEHHQPWLRYAYLLAPYHGEVAYQLAQYLNPNDASSSLNSLVLEKRQQQYAHWLNVSVRLNYIKAVNPLVNMLIKKDEYEQAQSVLAPYHQHSEMLKKAFILALNKGDIDKLQALKPLVDNNKQLEKFRQTINQYLSVAPVNERKHTESLCSGAHIVQPYATHFVDLVKTEELITQLEGHSLAQYFCFLPVRYVPLPELFCTHENRDVIQCDETQWSDEIINQAANFSMIVLPKGGANVHGSIMYLDRFDTIDVVLHELSHFLGFVDEYPLINNHVFCQHNSNHKALNVSIVPRFWLGERANVRKQVLELLPWKHYIKPSTPILTQMSLRANNEPLLKAVQEPFLSLLKRAKNNNKNAKLWLLGTPMYEGVNNKINNEQQTIGIYPSLTCQNTHMIDVTGNILQSVKPLYEQTSLQYFEVAFPSLYLDLINQSAQ